MSEYPHIRGLGIMPAKPGPLQGGGPHNTNILTYVGRTEKLSSGQVNRGNPFENRFVVCSNVLLLLLLTLCQKK